MINYVLTDKGLEATDEVARNVLLDPEVPIDFELVETINVTVNQTITLR